MSKWPLLDQYDSISAKFMLFNLSVVTSTLFFSVVNFISKCAVVYLNYSITIAVRTNHSSQVLTVVYFLYLNVLRFLLVRAVNLNWVIIWEYSCHLDFHLVAGSHSFPNWLIAHRYMSQQCFSSWIMWLIKFCMLFSFKG